MKNILLVCLLLIVTRASAHDMVMPIISVIDGDTIKTILTLPCPLCYASIRIVGIDAPETTYLAKCDKEKALGIKATEYVKAMTKGFPVMVVKEPEWDKYGGRINARVEVNGKDIGQTLIKVGLAQVYTGIGPKPNWCN